MLVTQVYSVRRRGFTMTEVMVVIGLIVVILAILLPALSSVRSQAVMADSMSNLRQISTFMQLYSSDNRDTVVPSQFDYRSPEFVQKGRVRSQVPDVSLAEYDLGEEEHEGIWADILWVENGLSIGPGVSGVDLDQAFRYTAPDRRVYEQASSYRENPFRSVAMNSREYQAPDGTSGSGPKPYGTGAREQGLPGFFAANDYFNARPDAPDDVDGEEPPTTGRWYSMGQIRSPSRSMYLVDSFAGSIIEPTEDPFNNIPDSATGHRSIEVDFRYNGSALMLFLDGHVDPANPWDDLETLRERGIRVQSLDRR